MALYGQEHVERYRATDGKEGHEWRGSTVLLLTTTGRRTGKKRTTPLIYQQDGERYILVASDGGSPDHPTWFKNLSADPHVEVQVWGDRFEATASVADGEERARLWKLMAATWPAYDQYKTRTEREIPVVILTRS